MINDLMSIQNQLLGEAARQWGGLAKEMKRARSEYLRLAATQVGDTTNQPPQQGQLEAGRSTATNQDAWNTVNGGPQ